MPEHPKFRTEGVDSILIPFAGLTYLRRVVPLAPNRLLISRPFPGRTEFLCNDLKPVKWVDDQKEMSRSKVPGCRESELEWVFSGEPVLY